MADSPDHCIEQITVKESDYLDFHIRYNTFFNSFTDAEHSEGMFCLLTVHHYKSLQITSSVTSAGDGRASWLACANRTVAVLKRMIRH